jgi:hypothetical protein
MLQGSDEAELELLAWIDEGAHVAYRSGAEGCRHLVKFCPPTWA